MMRDLVATLIAAQTDLEVVGEVYGEKDVIRLSRHSRRMCL